ncbi:MAG: leucine-rich repeat domain-containing protein [Oscillibacter sp.]|nr:leucine-rich repeat domain-containing protein [Oscillibacter sp.]
MDYDPKDLRSVLLYMRGKFGAGIFEEPPRMFSILLDLAPRLKPEGNALRQMSDAGLLRELRKVSESGNKLDAVRTVAKSRQWLADYLMLGKKADYFVAVLQTVYGLEVEPPTPDSEDNSTPPPKPPILLTTPAVIDSDKPEDYVWTLNDNGISGKTGDCTWTLDNNGILTISGSGKMGNYFYDSGRPNSPWWDNSSFVRSIEVKSGVTSIGYFAFYYCKNVICVNIPDSVTSIGEHAFHGCLNMNKVNIPDSVTAIEHCAFYFCQNLKSVSISAKTIVAKDAFDSYTTIIRRAPPLQTIIPSHPKPASKSQLKPRPTPQPQQPKPPLPPQSAIIDSGYTGTCKWTVYSNHNLMISGNGKMGTYFLAGSNVPPSRMPPWEKYKKHIEHVCISYGVTSIGDKAFASLENLTSVTISDSVTSIERSAFSGCVGLISVIISNRLTSIKAWTFAGCTRLTSITIPDSVVFIGNFAFSGCNSLKNVTIPDRVTSIDDCAFHDCSQLTQISISRKTNIAPNAVDPHTQIIRR